MLQETARVHEAVNTQMQSMGSLERVNRISPKDHQRKEKEWNGKRSGKEKKVAKERQCNRCGRTGHSERDRSCPALGKACNKCGLLGYFAACCRSKVEKKRPGGKQRSDGANQISEEPEEDYYAFVVKCDSDLSGVADLYIGGVQPNNVLIDSGATCNIVDLDTWKSLKQEGVKCRSQRCERKLFAYGQTEPIEVLGTFESGVYCEASGERCVDEFTVVKSHGRALLGKDTAEKLNVLRVGPPNLPQVYSITSEGTSVDIVKNFPDVFSGVGKLKDYQLKLHVNKDVKPLAQPLRRLPFGLREKVDKKLDELLKEDIIEEVHSGPTEWVSPLVVVPKPDGDIRICIDMRRANEAIERERHPIPTIEEVLHDLNGSTVFSKLDLKWGFHQVELDPESREITTFITHRGLFHYKRLMFGITSAPEKYQKIVKDALIGCKGVKNIADDLIIHGCGIQEHDENLLAVLRCLRKCGLTLNEKKCQFKLPKLTFFGHNLSKQGISPSEEKVSAIQNAKPPQNSAEVKSFLGLVQYCAKFLPDYSQVAEPLRILTRKDQHFMWGDPQEKSFQRLKDLLTQVDTLACFKNECRRGSHRYRSCSHSATKWYVESDLLCVPESY